MCDRTITNKSKSEHVQSLTHIEFERRIRVKNTIEKPDFSDVDEIVNVFITNHNKKKFTNYLLKYDLQLACDRKFTPHTESELRNNRTKFP